MARIHELIRQVERINADLASELKIEAEALASRRSFGLNFERHVPESVDLPGRPIRRNDKVRILPPRGSVASSENERVWRVASFETAGTGKVARLESTDEQRENTFSPIEDLVVVAEFRDPIYPGLVSSGKVERGGDRPFHTVINGENFHALEALLFTHRAKVDVIYVDPPYNTGARDWKYNNDYVEAEDLYRHSKWLAFMERRLKLAKELLNPENSTLIVTIDEKEYLRLGLLLEQIWPGHDIQMISSVINPSGSSRAGRFARTDEYIFFVFIGGAQIQPWSTDMLRDVTESQAQKVRWSGLIRNGEGSRRSRIPSLFYPIFIDKESGAYHSVGMPLSADMPASSVQCPQGTIAILPIDGSGQELMWRLHPPTFKEYLSKGYVKFGRRDPTTGQRSPQYLQRGTIAKIESGDIEVLGHDEEGAVQVEFKDGAKTYSPMTMWNRVSHSAGDHGSANLKALIPGRKFPYPKSLYAVEDTLRFLVKNNPNALVLDFFAGSGTTANAVMRLNKQDGGNRQSISITNNEVSDDEQRTLVGMGLRPGDVDWESRGICEYITKPRIEAAITGKTPDGQPIKGDYKFTDEFPMSDGFIENVEFFTLTYESPLRVSSNREFAKIAPLLWLRSGSQGRRIEHVNNGWDVTEHYAVISDFDKSEPFLAALSSVPNLNTVFIITDEDRIFESMVRDLPDYIEPVRLYESYLRNFEIDAARSMR